MENSHSCYLRQVFSIDELALTVNKCVNELRELMKDGLEFDAIACRGVSGITIASPVSIALRKQLTVVRKDNEQSHANYGVEGLIRHPHKYIFIDDFRASGRTLYESIEKIRHQQATAECVGMYSYNEGCGGYVGIHKIKLDHLKGS